MKRKIYIFKVVLNEKKKPNPIAIVWNNKEIFTNQALYYKVIQGTYESNALNGWFEVLNTSAFDPRLEFRIIVVGRKNKDYTLSTNSFEIRKKTLFGWKNADARVFLENVQWTDNPERSIKNIKKEESIVIDTAIDFYRGMLRLGLLAIGGFLIWKRAMK